jgi:hypothetical protein
MQKDWRMAKHWAMHLGMNLDWQMDHHWVMSLDYQMEHHLDSQKARLKGFHLVNQKEIHWEKHLETNSLLGCQKEHCWDRNFHLVIQMESCLEFH